MLTETILIARAEMLKDLAYKRWKRAVCELYWIAPYLRQTTKRTIEREENRIDRLNQFLAINNALNDNRD